MLIQGACPRQLWGGAVHEPFPNPGLLAKVAAVDIAVATCRAELPVPLHRWSRLLSAVLNALLRMVV